MSSIFPFRSPKPYAPWLDLPAQLTELILERLPLSDYVRFAAVCVKWCSIQREHRLRGAPNPPTMLPLPWLVLPEPQEDDSIFCYSPFEQRSYRLIVPGARLYNARYVLPHGWLLLLRNIISRRKTSTFYLVNLVSKVHIPIRPLRPGLELDNRNYIVAVSSSVLLIVGDEQLHVFRSGDPGWTNLQLPMQMQRQVVDAICMGEKFYCLLWGLGLFVVDPHPHPAIETLEMDWSQVEMPQQMHMQLVECCGDLLLVVTLLTVDAPGSSCDTDVSGFRVYKADLLGSKWTRVESIGDQMLIANDRSCTSLLAADVGGRRNCIYFPDTLFAWTGLGNQTIPILWRLFDLGTNMLEHMAIPESTMDFEPYQLYAMSWIIPNIC